MKSSDGWTRCTAHRTHGGQCRGPAIKGGTVCRVHGGGARHVREAAQARLEAMVHPALTALRKLIDAADSDSVKLSAIRDILDRTGYKLPLQIQAEQEMVIRVEYVEQPTGYLQPLTHHYANGYATHTLNTEDDTT